MSTQNTSIIMNTLPMLTWRHLGMNGLDLSLSYQQHPYTLSQEIFSQEGVSLLKQQSQIARPGSLPSFVAEANNLSYTVHIPKNKVLEKPLVFAHSFDLENPTLIDYQKIVVESGAKATLIRSFESREQDLSCFHAGSTEIVLKEGAQVTMLNLRFLEEGSQDLDALHVTLGKRANFTLVEVVMGSGKTYLDNLTLLEGEGSKATLGCMQVLDKQALADFNFHMKHIGEKSTSLLQVRGSLADEAQKLFRGTLDFVSGCKGSAGEENEYCTLLSSTVKNRSVPLILCGEEDVEGAHAVSSGKLDHQALFYLTSRGIDEHQAKRMLVEAQLYPIFAMIEDEQIVSTLKAELSRRLDSYDA